MDVTGAVLPLGFASDEARLLSGLVIGFLFGFVLERSGFGNARKLAGQFYLTDMTVFKVMFTAILVAMAGVHVLAGAGLLDMGRIWVNPTFIWAQLAGGFLLGIGFILSGLCPGTSIVAAASGRWDGVATIGGIFVGMAAFAVAIDVVPGLGRLYGSGAMGVSVLPALLGVPALPLVLAVVVMAAAAFVGAEKLERAFGARREPVELTPAPRPLMKYALAATLVVVLAAGLGLRPAPRTAATPALRVVDPAVIARRLISGDPDLVILDVRVAGQAARFPAAFAAALDGTAAPLLAAAGTGVDVLLVDDDGSLAAVPLEWPQRREYLLLRDGWVGWERDVLTPATATTATREERERVQRQNEIAAFFSGTATAPATAAAPPPMPAAAGGGGRPKRGGC